MNTTGVNFDANALAMGAVSGSRKGQVVDGAFQALFAQITQNALAAADTGSGLQTDSLASPVSTGGADTSLVSPAGTPMARLEEAVRSTGQPLERFQVPSSGRAELKEALVGSGYREADAEQIINHATDASGRINLKKIFDQLPSYAPVEGPVLLMDLSDKPLLIQVLKDLGLSDQRIQAYLEDQTEVGGKLSLRGLPALLAETDGSFKQVDKSVLKDLLGRLGLSDSDIETLLAAGDDSQGRLSAQSVLAMLQRAAAKQDQTMGQALKSLAAKIEVESPDAGADDSRQIKAQIIKAMDAAQAKAEASQAKTAQVVTKDGSAETLAQAGKGIEAKDAPKPEQFGRLADAKLDGDASRLAAQQSDKVVTSGSEARQAGSQTGGQVAAGEAAEKATTVETKAASQTQTQNQTAQAVSAGGRATVSQAVTAQVRGPLPAYVVRQVSDQIVQMAAKGQDVLKLQLKPANLGELDLAISVKDGVVKATLVAQTVAAKQALDAGLDNLRQQLANAGLKADSLEVMVNPDAQRQQAQADAGGGSLGGRAHGGRDTGQGNSSLAASAGDEETGATQAVAGSSRSRISLFA